MKQGWWIPPGTAPIRAHYILPDGRSLCGRWRTLEPIGESVVVRNRAITAFERAPLCTTCARQVKAKRKNAKIVKARAA